MAKKRYIHPGLPEHVARKEAAVIEELHLSAEKLRKKLESIDFGCSIRVKGEEFWGLRPSTFGKFWQAIHLDDPEPRPMYFVEADEDPDYYRSRRRTAHHSHVVDPHTALASTRESNDI